MEIVLKRIFVLFTIALLAATACRDRDTVLAPDGPLGRLNLAVTFDTLAASASAATGSAVAVKSGVRAQATLSQADSINRIHASVYDETSAGAGRLLAESDLAIDRTGGTFSGSLEVVAGDSRVAAVQAHTNQGIEWLGVSAPLTVPGGG
ncbi:MAG TPA: hypothetical protein VJ417_01885, partial [Candidatus Glassbacteria bacterium]|nr:hypothetical protein [Candidatus Glassbacteria bacterium]